MSPATKGVVVVLAGLGLAITLGTLCVCVLVGIELLRPVAVGGFGWSVSQMSITFAAACASFVVALVAGGAVQDRLGPRWPSTSGGVLIGLGMIVASMSEAVGAGELPLLTILGLGLMVGGGAGLTLASVVPPLIKWSVHRHRGLVVGLALAGLSLGPLWVSRPIQAIVEQRGVQSVLLVLGIVLLSVIVGLSQLLEDPFVGYVPPGSYSDPDDSSDDPVPWAGLPPRAVLTTPTFRALWASGLLMGAATAFVGVLLVLAYPTQMPGGFAAVPGVAIGGVIGAVTAGVLLDQLGRKGIPVAAALLASCLAGGGALGVLGSSELAALLIAASWSGVVVLVWVTSIQCFGTRSAGANYGLVATGWSVGLLLGSAAGVTSAGYGMATAEAVSITPLASVLLVSVLVLAVVLADRVRRIQARLSVDQGGTGRARGPRG